MLFHNMEFCLLHRGYSKFLPRSISLMALLDHPVIHLIFQRFPTIIQNFHTGSFSFWLVQFVPEDDILIYHVTNCDFCMLMFFLGIHTSLCCDYHSNVYFVHFIWELLERFQFKICHYHSSVGQRNHPTTLN